MTNKPEQEKRLKQYLEVEKLLSEFFKEVGYCKEQCTSQAVSRYSDDDINYPYEGFVGCCFVGAKEMDDRESQAAEFDLLVQRRVEKYGRPIHGVLTKDGEKTCGYHTLDGCVLEDHKPLGCITYICNEQDEHLKSHFGITIDFMEIYYNFHDLVAGRMSEKEFGEFKARLRGYVEEIKARKK